MPNDSAETKIPEEAMNAFLDGIVQELASPSDPATLTRVRAMFRKRIPLHMRSYAAALLIMRAAGLSGDDMNRFHQEFERSAPAEHQEFLEFLKIPAAEITQIRDLSRKGK